MLVYRGGTLCYAWSVIFQTTYPTCKRIPCITLYKHYNLFIRLCQLIDPAFEFCDSFVQFLYLLPHEHLSLSVAHTFSENFGYNERWKVGYSVIIISHNVAPFEIKLRLLSTNYMFLQEVLFYYIYQRQNRIVLDSLLSY